MDRSLPSPFVVRQQSRDFDEFAEAARGWDLDFRQLDSGSFRSDMVQVATSEVNVGHARLNRLLDQYGAPPAGLRTFALLSERSSHWVWRHQDVPANALLVYPHGADYNAVSRPGFDGFAISISEDLLVETAAAMGLSDIEMLTRGAEVLKCDHTAMTGLRSWLTTFCDAIRQGASPTAGRFRFALETDLPRRLLEALQQGRATKGYASARVRRHAVRSAKAFIDEAGGRRITIVDLANVVGVSERTLQYAFLEYFEVTPAAYLRDVRLNHVRSALKHADPAATLVADVANRWGFWHMGQFAKDYRRLFGVRPSETLYAA